MAYRDPRVTCQPWITTSDLCCAGAQDRSDCDGNTVTPTYPWTDEQLIQSASNLLFARTCFRYPGICELSVWPCIGCGGCGRHPCKCGSYYAIELTSDYPILDVTSIEIDGVALDPALWRLEENARIVRLDGEPWPTCNNLGLSSGPITLGEEVIVNYTSGRVPPIELRMAAAELVCELKKACNGDESCKLPAHVRTIERRGVEMELDSIFSLLESGLTGNPIIDHALSVYGKCPGASMFDPTHYGDCGRMVVRERVGPPALPVVLSQITFIDDTDSPYAITATDEIVLVDSCAGPVTVILPASHTAGDQYEIKDRYCCSSGNSITVQSADADTIDGQPSYVIGIDCQGIRVLSDGTNWNLV